LNFRVSGATVRSAYMSGTLLGTANIPIASWSTVSTTVTLPAGTQPSRWSFRQRSTFQLDAIPASQWAGGRSDRCERDGGQCSGGFGWSPAAGATSYNVQSRRPRRALHQHRNSDDNQLHETGLANGTTYYYVVSATDGVNVSSNSIEVSATPVFSHANLR